MKSVNNIAVCGVSCMWTVWWKWTDRDHDGVKVPAWEYSIDGLWIGTEEGQDIKQCREKHSFKVKSKCSWPAILGIQLKYNMHDNAECDICVINAPMLWTITLKKQY